MEIPTSLFLVCFAAFVGYFLFRVFKYGGLRVHVLENRQIVLELKSRTMLSASLHGYPMTTDDAGQLVALLQQARS